VSCPGRPGRVEEQHRLPAAPHTHTLTPPPTVEEGKAHEWGHWPIPPGSPCIVVMPATAKTIHKKGPSMHPKLLAIHSGDCDLLPHHQKGMRGKINVCRCTHMGGGAMGCRGGPGKTGLLIPGMGEGGSALLQPHTHPYLTPEPDQPSHWSQFLSQSYGPQNALM
jgi:hypothetical protein